MVGLSCMSFLGKESNEMLVAGHQKVMYKIDVEQGTVIKEVRGTLRRHFVNRLIIRRSPQIINTVL